MDVWCIDFAQTYVPQTVLLLVVDTSGHEDGITSGLGCVVTTLIGRVLWEGQAWIRLWSANTELLECTAVLEGVRVVVQWQQACSHTVSLLLAVCDNQTTAQVGYLCDTVVADVIDLDHYAAVVHALGPAKHDTHNTGVVSRANCRSDELAKAAQQHLQGARWDMPSSWAHGHTKGCRCLTSRGRWGTHWDLQ